MSASDVLQDLTVQRVLDGSPQEVWYVWTDPERLHRFFAPEGSRVPLDSVRMDVRVGGEFSLRMVNIENGEIYPMDAQYTKLDEPQGLSFKTSGGMQGTIELEDLGHGKTLLTWTTRADFGASDEFRKDATIGTHSAADQLVDLMAELR